MVGVSRALVVLHVTSRARAAGQAVVAVHVTLGTRQVGVGSGQCEPRAGMVEGGISPGGGAVAALASLRDRGLNVIRIGRALIVLQMARDTCGVGEVVISVDVTLRALQWDVRPGQGEACG